jgi:hypothetical protein
MATERAARREVRGARSGSGGEACSGAALVVGSAEGAAESARACDAARREPRGAARRAAHATGSSAAMRAGWREGARGAAQVTQLAPRARAAVCLSSVAFRQVTRLRFHIFTPAGLAGRAGRAWRRVRVHSCAMPQLRACAAGAKQGAGEAGGTERGALAAVGGGFS